MNLCILDGNLGANAEISETKAGVPVANFRMATHEYYYDADNERQKRTQWHRVAAFGSYVGQIGVHLKKGRGVLVKGKLQTNKWVDKSGEERQAIQIRADSVTLHPVPAKRDENEE